MTHRPRETKISKPTKSKKALARIPADKGFVASTKPTSTGGAAEQMGSSQDSGSGKGKSKSGS
jgi:hypothetical protein